MEFAPHCLFIDHCFMNKETHAMYPGKMWITNSFSNQKCRLAMAQEAMASYNFFMGVQKNSPFIEPLNKEYVISNLPIII